MVFARDARPRRSPWTLRFSDYTTEMMGILELYFWDDKAIDSEAWVACIRESVSKSLFAPNHWDMTR